MPEGRMTEKMRRLLARVSLAALLAACAGAPLPSVVQAAQGTAASTVQGAPAVTDTGAKKDAAAPVFVARPHFAADLPAEVNEKAAAEVRFFIAEPLTESILEEEAPPESVEIMGAAEATPEQMAAFIRRRNPQPKLACSVEEIVRLYYEEAGAEGVRADIALCQALKETGFFAYGGDVLPAQNNYCGLGATGNKAKGAYLTVYLLNVPSSSTARRSALRSRAPLPHRHLRQDQEVDGTQRRLGRAGHLLRAGHPAALPRGDDARRE